MAKYLISHSVPLPSGHVYATPAETAIIDVSDETVPNRLWKPLDEPAAEALKKFKAHLESQKNDDGKPAIDKALIAQMVTEVVGVPVKPAEKAQPDTLSELQGKKKRAADSDRV